MSPAVQPCGVAAHSGHHSGLIFPVLYEVYVYVYIAILLATLLTKLPLTPLLCFGMVVCRT